MKRCVHNRFAAFVSIAVAAFMCVFTSACTSKTGTNEPGGTGVDRPDMSNTVVVSHDVIGCGGYGAVFHSQIDPFDTQYFGATCDMGSVYFSHDGGASWMRHNLDGTFYALEYDPSSEGVVWAAGSGVYKSVDHGRTMRLVFPKPSEITSSGHNYENANVWLYTDKVSDYAPHYQIWSMAINRKSGGKNVFAAQRVSSAGMGYNKCIRIYSTSDGENFSLFTELEYSYNFKIDYDESNDCLVVITPERIYEINADGEIACTIEQPVVVQFSAGNNISFDSYYDAASDKNTFVFSSPSDGEHAATVCYMTTDLRDKSKYVDLTAQLCALTTNDFGVENIADYNKNRPSYEYCEWIGGKTVPQQFKWTINDVAVADGNVAYIFHEARTDTFDTNGKLYINRRTMIYLRYDATKPAGKRFNWVYGMPLKPYNTAISNTAWPDSDSDYSLGMSATAQKPEALLYCSNVGIYYSPDGSDVKQLYADVKARDELTLSDGSGNSEKKTLQRVTSTGMDVICTHTVVTDPFDSSHLLMGCTDIGLLQSYDGGKSWYRGLFEWQDGAVKNINYALYTNTCFDIHFDKENSGVVYALWSHIKTAPTVPGANYLTSEARFAVSYDGGLSWTMKKITPDGHCLPYKLVVRYNGSGREIYVTTDSHGIFVTRDLGDTFTTMNDGIDTVKVGDKTAIWANKLIFSDIGTFALVGGSATDTTEAAHMLYKLNDSGKFEKLGLPETEPDDSGKTYRPSAVRDIAYDNNEKCLYLACNARSVTNGAKLVKRGGGIWKYKDGKYTQIYDDSISVGTVKVNNGMLYAAEFGGKLIRYNADGSYKTLCNDLFQWIKNIDFSPSGDVIYVSTWGGSVEKLTLGKK